MSKTKPKAIVIIPTYNERENIERTLSAIESVFQTISDWDMHVLVVDDTSPDKTYEVVESLAAKKKWVHLFLNKHKSGLGGAYLKGMAEAFGTMHADVIFEFDADLSHDPKKIPAMLKKIEQGADLVLGSRYIPGGSIPHNWGIHRKILSVGANNLVKLVLTDFSIQDWTAGYRAITKKVYDAVHQEMTGEAFTGYAFQIGFLHKTVRKGFRVAEVPIHFIDREIGNSKIGPEYIKNTLIYLLKARLKEILNHRIFKFAFVGGVGALVQLSSLYVLFNILHIFYQLAFFLAIEVAVASNFTLNNLWTFADRKLSIEQLPSKFVQFNLASAGSILIQQVIAVVGQYGIGLFTLFTLPFINFAVGTSMLYAIAGILIGMFWNFFAYNKFIWKKT